MVIFWLTGCLRGRNGQGHSLRIRYLVPFHCFAVGADPCVRPAETHSGFLLLGRMRSIRRPSQSFGQYKNLPPYVNQMETSPMGKPMGDVPYRKEQR